MLGIHVLVLASQLLIRIEAISACCCPRHLLFQPAPELGNTTKICDLIIQRQDGARYAKADGAHLDVLGATLDGQGAVKVTLEDWG